MIKQRIEFRIAAPEDAAALAAVYAPYVTGTSITFEYDPPGAEEFCSRIHQIQQQFPYLVCLLDGKIAGYAYAHAFHERAAYQWDAELSIYLHEDAHRKGIANALYNCLLTFLKEQGYLQVYALITIPNEPSIGFHSRYGFTEMGTYQTIGYKLGAWHDVRIMEKRLAPLPKEPTPPQPFSALNQTWVEEMLKSAAASVRK